jgi:hypothetical protein
LSIDKNNRQRGNDEDNAPLLIEGEAVGADVDVVIGGVEGNEADYQATDQLNQGLTVETEEPAGMILQVWRSCSPQAGQASRPIRHLSRVQPGHSRTRIQRD